MLIALWIVCLLAFLFSGAILLKHLLHKPGAQNSWQSLFSGFKDGLRGSGLLFKKRYPVDLYIWEVLNEELVSDECLERSTWPPMDIADWMAEGLPGTPESGIGCGENCYCRLVRFDPQQQPNKYPHNLY